MRSASNRCFGPAIEMATLSEPRFSRVRSETRPILESLETDVSGTFRDGDLVRKFGYRSGSVSRTISMTLNALSTELM